MGKHAAIQNRRTDAVARGSGWMNPGHRHPGVSEAIKARALETGLILLTCGIYARVIRLLSPVTIKDGGFRQAPGLLEASIREVHSEIGANT